MNCRLTPVMLVFTLTSCQDRMDSSPVDAGGLDIGDDEAPERQPSVIGGSAANVYGGICPPVQPIDGSNCGSVPGNCQYGEDPRLQFCVTNTSCTNHGTWHVIPPKDSCPPAPDPGTCPASADDARDIACDIAGSFCVYGETPCGCTACGVPGSFAEGFCPGTPTWHCATFSPLDPRCPPYPRNLGTTCDTDSLTCWRGCLWETCLAGVWTGMPPPTICLGP
jgi:hypothetical protein